jgi:hypothetical protein
MITYYFFDKTGWATLWATFFTNASGHPVDNTEKSVRSKLFVDERMKKTTITLKQKQRTELSVFSVGCETN